MGNSNFSHVKIYGGKIQLFYNETLTDREHHNLSIDNCTVETVKLNLLQTSYRVTLSIMNMLVQNKHYDSIYKSFVYVKELGTSELLIINCQFVSNIYRYRLFYFNSTRSGIVQFSHCQFKDKQYAY